MAICIILLVFGALCLTLFLFEKIRGYSLREALIKSFTSFIFIALAAYSNYQNGNHPFGGFVICALALGMLGDIWLELKYVFKERDRMFTFSGFISFALGHVLYIVGMMTTLYDNYPWFAFAGPILFGLMCGAIVLVMERPLKMKYREYKLICFIYGSLLFTTLGTTLFLCIYNSFQVASLNMLFAGALLFAISDLILSGTYFGQGKERPVDLISNSVTYYMAQYIIAFSLFFL